MRGKERVGRTRIVALPQQDRATLRVRKTLFHVLSPKWCFYNRQTLGQMRRHWFS
uniref:Macaca fascicularis brain cDNA clone: QbsB-10488, similar to human LOC389253 (LOC389253), mRNA, RefSeq: XM_374104.1 n=1 Tax=Macaca fascicularis TaxID=9541 RepID=I7G4T0_MACFA|nr:unnamed protein product [Macaca fascicularis]